MINAVILLNDDTENIDNCRGDPRKPTHQHKGTSNLYFLLSVSIPRPLFPIGGYPLIYHHVRRLSEIEQVRHVFLVGKYDPKKFSHFIDDLLTEFSFKTIQYIQDELPRNEGGVIFTYRNQILQDNPDYLFLMRYNLCSSFPLTDLMNFHKKKENELLEEQELMLQDNYKQVAENLAILSVMGARIPEEQVAFGCFAVNEQTQEVLHYTENQDIKVSNLENCGIYFISVRIYNEYGMSPYQDFVNADQDEPSSGLLEGYTTPKEIQQSTTSGSELFRILSNTHLQIPAVPDKHFHQFSHAFMYLNTIEESISIKDLMMPMCNKKKAFVYELDWTKDFIKDVLRHEDKLKCQNMYFQHYSKIEPCLLLEPDDLQSEQKIGHCCIHPTADIHPTAVIGPNVSIGAYAKVQEGCRIISSIILEDAEIQAHSVVINSIVGWNSKVGPWCRIEGSLFQDERSKKLYGQKFDVCVLGVGVVVEPETMLRNCLVMPFLRVKTNNANRIIF